MEYTFRPGLAFGGIDPNIAGGELERIRTEHGKLTAPLVVAEAAKQTCPLHDAFEWNDQKAAQSFREQTARNLIRSVMVVSDNDEPRQLYVHVRYESRDDNQYEPVDDVVSSPPKLEAALEELRSIMSSASESVLYVLRLSAQMRGTAKRVREARDAVRVACTKVQSI